MFESEITLLQALANITKAFFNILQHIREETPSKADYNTRAGFRSDVDHQKEPKALSKQDCLIYFWSTLTLKQP